MKSKIKDLADVLPEGLGETVISEIASLLQDIISERVDEEVGLLTMKVQAYLRQRMDSIQEAALNELAESSEVYRDAQALSNIKAVLAFEVDRDDIQHVASQVHEEVAQAQEDNALLANELAEVLKEKEQAERAIQVLEDKTTALTEETETLQEQVTELEADADADFESSERAIIIKDDEDKEENKTPAEETGNEFLTEEVMALLEGVTN